MVADDRGRRLWRTACDGDGLQGMMVGSLWVEDVGKEEVLRGKELQLVILDRMLSSVMLEVMNSHMVSNLEKLLMVVWWLLVGRSIDVGNMVRGC